MNYTGNEIDSSNKAETAKNISPERTTVKCLSLLGVSGGAPCAVDSRGDKLIRIRPLHYDSKYDLNHINPWKIEARGKTLEPLMKSLPSPFSLAYKKRAYSPNRIKYPLIRVDWDPEGERNTQQRGKSKYRRISWEKVTDIIANEIKRIHKKYGPLAILLQVDGHGEEKTVHYIHGNSALLLDKMGGFTQQVRNPDSWEGWYYGSKFVWGEGYRGLMRPQDNIMKDISQHSDMVLFWGCDPETTPWGFSGQSATRFCYFWKELNIKQVYICPDLNYGAAVHADKWIPILPNTDAAMQLAIIYTWVTEGTYDKEYVKTHTLGMDKVEDYVLGREDGIPKTPEWASKKCGVPEWTIKALAREFAKKVTSIAHYYGGSYIRGPYSHEPARLECILLGMQGLGKPGVHQCQISFGQTMPRAVQPPSSAPVQPGRGAFGPERIKLFLLHELTASVFARQFIPKTLIQEAILNPPITFMGTGALAAGIEDQLIKYTYPIPQKDGGTEIHMIWTDTPCRTTCWNDGNYTVEAIRSPKIECVIAQHPWLENDCLEADIILPSNTTLEVEDIVPSLSIGGSHVWSICYQGRSMQPIGESKSDFEVVMEIAKKLGMEKDVAEGKTVEELVKTYFERCGLSQVIDWEEFKEKGYYVCPTAKDWEKDPAGLIKFYQNPKDNPLPTPSGKLEFFSERLAKYFPEDEERPPFPKWIEKGVTHSERTGSERWQAYPLLMISNHGRWRVHSQCDDISWCREIMTCKIRGVDGYLYEPCWIHSSEAVKRGIKNGDILRVYNERGSVLAGAYVTERLIPGAAYMDHGARVDFIIPGKLDRGGAINLISPRGTISKNCIGQATSGYLVEVKKVTIAEMEEWRLRYPEAFEREYDLASGLCFNAWIEKEEGLHE